MPLQLDPKKDKALLKRLQAGPKTRQGVREGEDSAQAAQKPAQRRTARLAPGDGDRIEALGTLAERGYCYFEAAGGTAFRFRHYATGAWTPTKPTYREAVDAALEHTS